MKMHLKYDNIHYEYIECKSEYTNNHIFAILFFYLLGGWSCSTSLARGQLSSTTIKRGQLSSGDQGEAGFFGGKEGWKATTMH